MLVKLEGLKRRKQQETKVRAARTPRDVHPPVPIYVR